jgi:hypothetical protein
MVENRTEAIWLKPYSGDREDLLARLKYAGDQDWVEEAAANEIRLTAKVSGR